jgi:NADPH:quinone reductase-like Zn-dependent oxidoreductase
MHAFRLYGPDDVNRWVYEDAPTPEPGEGEVLIRVHAAGVINTEVSWVPTWTTRTGAPRPLPVIPGHEFSGEITALGPNVAGLRVGDMVYGLNDWYRDGAQAECCAARVADVARKPARVDHVDASS